MHLPEIAYRTRVEDTPSLADGSVYGHLHGSLPLGQILRGWWCIRSLPLLLWRFLRRVHVRTQLLVGHERLLPGLPFALVRRGIAVELHAKDLPRDLDVVDRGLEHKPQRGWSWTRRRRL